MSFSRKGTPVGLSVLEYSQTNERAVICSSCNSILGYSDNNSKLMKIGSAIIPQTDSIKCAKCGKDTNFV